MTAGELHAELVSRGLMPEARVLPADPVWEGNAAPWFVQVFIGFSAWLAGLFLLAFLGTVLESMHIGGRDFERTFLVLGIFCLAGAAVLYASAAARNLFVAQFALAMSCAGQVGVGVGLGEAGGAAVLFWGMLVVEVILAAVMKNHLHRFLSSTVAAVAWALAMRDLILRDLRGVDIQGPHELQSVLLWVVVWAPVVFAVCALDVREADWMARGLETILRPVMQGLIAALAIAPVALFPSIFWAVLGFGSAAERSSSGWVALWPLLGALLSMLAVALAFRQRNRPLMGLAILFALLDLGCFYYVLGTTLLVKSILMIILGGIMLAGARQLGRSRI